MYLTRTRVLIVDDSNNTRRALANALQSRSGIEVVGVAEDPYEAKELVLRHKPDVLLIDIDMPRMDGLSFIRILMKYHPMPVVVLSYHTRSGSSNTMDCLKAGAIDVVRKPANDADIHALGDELARKLKSASTAKVRLIAEQRISAASNRSSKVRRHVPALQFSKRQSIFIGASTGGTEALFAILEALPKQMPPILIVQHIPAGFSKAFADRANRHAQLQVKEAEDGDIARPGVAYVAPGNHHMTIDWSGGEQRIRINQDEPVWHQRPSVDTLFRSVPKKIAAESIGVILTGMGRDGAEGLLQLKSHGACTFGQDAESSAVYGMPKAAFELGAVQTQLDLAEIADALVEQVRKQAKRSRSKSVTS